MPDDVFCIGFDISFVGIDNTAIGRVGLDSQPLVAPLQLSALSSTRASVQGTHSSRQEGMFLDRGSWSSVQFISLAISPRRLSPTILATQDPADILCCVP